MALKSKNYDICFDSLYAINGMLPEDYRVTISTIEYNKKTATSMVLKCEFCEVEHDIKAIKVYNLLLSYVARTLADKEYEKVWDCINPQCRKTNNYARTEPILNTLQEPIFLKCVPQAPRRNQGITDRNTFDRKIKKWIMEFLIELEHQMGEYRRNYVPKGGEVTDDLVEVDDSSTLEEFI